ncbi:LysR family transcriptional regulator [Neptunomonas japonica]|uniref:LysR family transcriptional regulator n=1 Tax=Neptunomonas japonica JAMM 1380 TaxID=1441457 RepID=A0A7R6PEM0_9GAMM|nr:LysR family transcriptional regulator [Neptunomonas japonica]BBB28088.1 LysR family transcriptional regulator [Neptunomonas japonica JAMM 1380]
MTLEQLRTLNHIVECGSLKLAAESLNKTQPALSMAIKNLEAEYGFQILNRQNYRLSLTQEGTLFYRKAQELLLNANQLQSMGKHLGKGNEPLIRFAYDLASPHALIFNVLKQCQRQYPETEIHVLCKSRFGALELLQNSQADLAVGPWWPTLHGVGDLDTVAINHFKVLLVASPELFQLGEVTCAGQLKPQCHLTVEESGLSFDSENLMMMKGLRQWKTQDAHTLKKMLLGGLGWGFIPEHMVQDELSQGVLVPLQPQDIEHTINGEIRLIRRKEQTLGPVATMLWESFIAANNKLPLS